MKKDFQSRKEKIVIEFPINAAGIDVRAVLEQCRPIMQQILGKEKEPEDWLLFLYDYCAAIYFPDNFCNGGSDREKEAAEFFLSVLQEVLVRERKETEFNRCRDFEHLTGQEEKDSVIKEEYQRFRTCFDQFYIYEFMRIARECTRFDTLGHIAGVHYVAMYIARQLVDAQIPIDLGLMSAAAIIHDIGKFGCKKKEAGRVPYLHYYYTDQFSRKYDLSKIGHIAANHSTWDLELSNLSVENLILIYADFRVKSIWDDLGREQVCFWSLDESYSIILNKLDYAAEKKERYRKVFMKLKDFENYLCSQGVSIDLCSGFEKPVRDTWDELLDMNGIVQGTKYRAIRFNLDVMRTMMDTSGFVGLLEKIQGEKDWRNIRGYLNVLEEYNTYMPQDKKEKLIGFLYEKMMHRDGDIRRQAARIMGSLIADFDVRYQKEVPEDAPALDTGKNGVDIWESVLHKMLFPDHRITSKHRRWIGYAMKTVFRRAIERSDPHKKRKILEVLINCCNTVDGDRLPVFILLDCLSDIPYEICDREEGQVLIDFAMNALKYVRNMEIKAAALSFLRYWSAHGQIPESGDISKLHTGHDEEVPLCIRYLTSEIEKNRGKNISGIKLDEEKATHLYQENQKTDIPWIFKIVHLEMLAEYSLDKGEKEQFQMAAHLVNMLKNSDRIVLKHKAGEYLTALIPLLKEEQRYEIVLELVKGLEISDYSVSKYIPEYLGKIFYDLSDTVKMELLGRYRKMVDNIDEKVAVVTLDTVGETMKYLYCHAEVMGNLSKKYEKMKEILVGVLLRGTAHYREEVSQEAFYIIGHMIFGNESLDLECRAEYFKAMGKKIYTMPQNCQNEVTWYSQSAVWNNLYSFLADYLFEHQSVGDENVKKIAFFPGTFDPFSKGHKEIVKEIRRQGFLVYLALDEFSWSKKSQPYEVRRRILCMSVADLLDVYIFPSDIPVNIANPQDLKKLQQLFAGKRLYLVMGSDVLDNASAYRSKERETSIHNFDHIIFSRNQGDAQSMAKMQEKCRKLLRKEPLFLSLPTLYERISSTQIRNNIDLNRDISNLVERNVQNYIYGSSLYAREPMYKMVAKSRKIMTYVAEELDESIKEELFWGLLADRAKRIKTVFAEGRQAVFIRDEKNYHQITGLVLFRRIHSSGFYDVCRDMRTAAWLRNHISGKIAVIEGIYGKVLEEYRDSRKTVLTEFFAHCLKQEYTYLLYFDEGQEKELLENQGFVPIEKGSRWYFADMRKPIVLFDDVLTVLKEPFYSNFTIREQVYKKHQMLQRAMTRLYPGNLVLSIESDILNYRLMELVKNTSFLEEENNEGMLGDKMCVPFGKILRGVRIPGCVTKELDTEKLYRADMRGFIIREFQDYADLRTQIRTIKSFCRPVILVDDLYHKGYRMAGIDTYLADEKVKIKKLIVGVMSGNGRDLAAIHDKCVESAYFVPNMRAWFMEAELYPFIGGDGIEKKQQKKKYLSMMPSINAILPYHLPHFVRDASLEAIYFLAEQCIKNTYDIFRTLEREYQEYAGRKLTISRIGEVIREPRYPDIFDEAIFEKNEALTVYIDYELKRLERMKNIMYYGKERKNGCE